MVVSVGEMEDEEDGCWRAAKGYALVVLWRVDASMAGERDLSCVIAGGLTAESLK